MDGEDLAFTDKGGGSRGSHGTVHLWRKVPREADDDGPRADAFNTVSGSNSIQVG